MIADRLVECVVLMSILEHRPNPNTTSVRVIIALDVPLYRDAMSQTMSHLRPSWEILEVLPEALDQSVVGVQPDVVICSELTEVVETGVRMWFVLLPAGSYRCVMAIDGIRHEESNMPFASILDHIEQAHDYVKLRN